MRTNRVPMLPLMMALVIAFVSAIVMFGKASAEAAPAAAGDVALDHAAKAKIVALAKNSKKLAGKPPSAYFDRVAFRSATDTLAVPGSRHRRSSPGRTSPCREPSSSSGSPGTARSSVGPANYIFWFAVDEVCQASGAGFDNRQFGNTTQQENSTIDFVVPVSPGVHTFRLCARRSRRRQRAHPHADAGDGREGRDGRQHLGQVDLPAGAGPRLQPRHSPLNSRPRCCPASSPGVRLG